MSQCRGTGAERAPRAGNQRGSPRRAAEPRERCPALLCSSLPAHTLRTAPGEPAGHPRWFIRGGGQPSPSPAPGVSGLCRCPPGRAPFLSPARFPTSPRVAGDSPAHPRGSPLRAAGRRGTGRGRAAADRQKTSIPQPLLNPSSRDGSGQPQRVKVKGFVTAEKREKWGEEGERKDRSDAEEDRYRLEGESPGDRAVREVKYASVHPSIQRFHRHPPGLHPCALTAVLRGWDPPGEGAAAAGRGAERSAAVQSREHS